MLTIRTLTEAGVAISSIRNLAAASDADIEMTLADLDSNLVLGSSALKGPTADFAKRPAAGASHSATRGDRGPATAL